MLYFLIPAPEEGKPRAGWVKAAAGGLGVPFLGEIPLHADIRRAADAGTPLVSDPGYRLVREVRTAGLKVSPVPGACAGWARGR